MRASENVYVGKSRRRFIKQPDATSSGLTSMWDVGSNVGAKLVTIERNSEKSSPMFQRDTCQMTDKGIQ